MSNASFDKVPLVLVLLLLLSCKGLRFSRLCLPMRLFSAFLVRVFARCTLVQVHARAMSAASKHNPSAQSRRRNARANVEWPTFLRVNSTTIPSVFCSPFSVSVPPFKPANSPFSLSLSLFAFLSITFSRKILISLLFFRPCRDFSFLFFFSFHSSCSSSYLWFARAGP